jgi:hypothetical protein
MSLPDCRYTSSTYTREAWWEGQPNALLIRSRSIQAGMQLISWFTTFNCCTRLTMQIRSIAIRKEGHCARILARRLELR